MGFGTYSSTVTRNQIPNEIFAFGSLKILLTNWAPDAEKDHDFRKSFQQYVWPNAKISRGPDDWSSTIFTSVDSTDIAFENMDLKKLDPMMWFSCVDSRWGIQSLISWRKPPLPTQPQWRWFDMLNEAHLVLIMWTLATSVGQCNISLPEACVNWRNLVYF